jgi:hypothetical protein
MKTRVGIAAAIGLAAASWILPLTPSIAAAATQVPAARGRLSVDVWMNKEEGGVYQSGEKMQVYFRASEDAYVLIYNVDTEGYIHLVYPFRPRDPVRVQGGETYRVPARHDPYDLVAEGPTGVEYIVAMASPLPFLDLPWYLAPGPSEESRDAIEDGDDLDQGVIVGDPYVGMERLHRRLVPEDREDQVASADTYFYIDRRVEYPRYVCADCHHRTYGFDPYTSHCSVIEIRIDATWARYAPLRVHRARPRFYYNLRSTAPTRYRKWKSRWSSLDGSSTLRSKFVLEREPRSREVTPRRTTPPEFKDLRRNRPGRFWQGRDQILRVRERREQAEKEARDRSTPSKERRDRGDARVTPRSPRDREVEKRPEPRKRDADIRREERKRPEGRREPPPDRKKGREGDGKEREKPSRESDESGDRPKRDSKEESPQKEKRPDSSSRQRERDDRSGRGR